MDCWLDGVGQHLVDVLMAAEVAAVEAEVLFAVSAEAGIKVASKKSAEKRLSFSRLKSTGLRC